MGNNPLFPDWEDANDILNAFVDDNFGLYISKPTEETAYLTFLPEDKLAEMIPAQHAPILNERARIFTNQMTKFFNKYKILAEIKDELPEAEKEAIIRLRHEAAEKLHRADFGEAIVTRLKKTLGLREVYDKLQKKTFKIDRDFKEPPHQRFEGKFKSLCHKWNMNGTVLRAIFDAFSGNFDYADEYLEFMDSEEYFDPKWAWKAWVNHNKIPPFQAENPFEKQSYTLGFQQKQNEAIDLIEEAQCLYDEVMAQADMTKKLKIGVDAVLRVKKIKRELGNMLKVIKRNRALKSYISDGIGVVDQYLTDLYNDACGIDY